MNSNSDNIVFFIILFYRLCASGVRVEWNETNLLQSGSFAGRIPGESGLPGDGTRVGRHLLSGNHLNFADRQGYRFASQAGWDDIRKALQRPIDQRVFMELRQRLRNRVANEVAQVSPIKIMQVLFGNIKVPTTPHQPPVSGTERTM